MNLNKALKIGIGLVAGGLTGYIVYKGISNGFEVTEPQNNNNLKRAKIDMAHQQSVIKDVTAANKTVANNESLPSKPEETKGSIIRKGLRSAANACNAASVAAQCISGIAESVNQVATILNGGGQQPMTPGYGNYCNSYGNYYNNGYNPIYTGNGQVWNRISPFVVTTGPGIGVGPANNNYAI